MLFDSKPSSAETTGLFWHSAIIGDCEIGGWLTEGSRETHPISRLNGELQSSINLKCPSPRRRQLVQRELREVYHHRLELAELRALPRQVLDAAHAQHGDGRMVGKTQRLEYQLVSLGPLENKDVDEALSGRVPHSRSERVVLVLPGLRSVDGFPVDAQPGAQLEEPLLEDGLDDAVFGRSDVDEEVAVAAHGAGEFREELLDGSVVGQLGVPPVTPRAPVDGHGVLPLVGLQDSRVEVVLAVVEVSVLAGNADAPAVVYEDSVFDGAVVVQPGEKRGAVPVGVGRLPVTIGPDHIRFVPAKKVPDLDAFFVSIDENLDDRKSGRWMPPSFQLARIAHVSRLRKDINLREKASVYAQKSSAQKWR